MNHPGETAELAAIAQPTVGVINNAQREHQEFMGSVADVAAEKGKWGVTYDHPGSCKVDACLTAPYWIWGPEYKRIAEQVKAKTYTAGYEYFDADSGAMGLFGFMDGQTPQPGVASLPGDTVQQVKDLLAKMLAGQFNRFDVFAGPNYILSLRPSSVPGFTDVRARCEREPELLRIGSGFVLYAIIDAIAELDADFAAAVESLAGKAGITYVDVWDGFVDDQGRYAVQGPDFEGQTRRLRTSDGVSLWSHHFDMRMTDIFAIQDDIARAVDALEQAALGAGHDDVARDQTGGQQQKKVSGALATLAPSLGAIQRWR